MAESVSSVARCCICRAINNMQRQNEFEQTHFISGRGAAVSLKRGTSYLCSLITFQKATDWNLVFRNVLLSFHQD